VSGSQRLYDFVNDNPFVQLHDITYVNDTSAIRKLKKMVAINSAIEIDLTGQVCADSIARASSVGSVARWISYGVHL
jgi:acyl-CoA hydrolase